MDNYHKKIYDSLKLILEKGKDASIPIELNFSLAKDGYIVVDDREIPKVTEYGLSLVRELERIKHNDLTRIIALIGILSSAVLSIIAIVISVIALRGGWNDNSRRFKTNIGLYL